MMVCLSSKAFLKSVGRDLLLAFCPRSSWFNSFSCAKFFLFTKTRNFNLSGLIISFGVGAAADIQITKEIF
jgi:hypothetical protein